MKNKITAVLILLVLFCATAFADGDMPNTKSCPGSTTCLVQETVNTDKNKNLKNSSFLSLLLEFLDILG